MIVQLLGGPLAGRALKTTDAPWAGGWLTAGDADWGLYVPVYRDAAAGIVLAEARVTIPHWRQPAQER
ncbi:hypothetical protein ACFV8Z_49880 [Streptomyces sp. NPDC059837]|uniref:hypothetical protein n=1 Tax=Streptomyces sp. NPDC059837 TaxID=3346968 RepID=UPI00364AF691